MKIGVVTNTLSTKKDDLTTHDIALAALNKGHKLFFMGVLDFYSVGNSIKGNVYPISGKIEKRSDLLRKIGEAERKEIELDSLDAIFLRHKHKKHQKILESFHRTAREYCFHLSERGVLVINDPKFLPFASSKIATMGLDKTILPENQMASNNFEQIYDYCKNVLNYEGVMKPLNGSGGDDIYFIDKKNLRNNLKNLLEQGQIVVQSYIKSEGDKRIVVLNGEAIAWYMRVAQEGELLHNIHAGGKPVKCDLSERDKKVIEKVGPRLVKYGIYLAGIDTLGGYLSEINSENPGGTVRADALGGFNSRDKIIEFVESRVKK
jgi:glutathione synthase